MLSGAVLTQTDSHLGKGSKEGWEEKLKVQKEFFLIISQKYLFFGWLPKCTAIQLEVIVRYSDSPTCRFYKSGIENLTNCGVEVVAINDSCC